MQAADAPRLWQRPHFIQSPFQRQAVWVALLAYGVFAAATVDVDAVRMAEGFARASDFFSGWLRPDFVTRWTDIRIGLVESLAMTAMATALGLVLSIPLGLGAARNLAPAPIYALSRSILALFRAFHEILLAIVFVAMFGFGPFAGLVTLLVGTIGFLGKLLAESAEEMDSRPLDALTTAGAP
jgi:phosphonate transport system permease protein